MCVCVITKSDLSVGYDSGEFKITEVKIANSTSSNLIGLPELCIRCMCTVPLKSKLPLSRYIPDDVVILVQI